MACTITQTTKTGGTVTGTADGDAAVTWRLQYLDSEGDPAVRNPSSTSNTGDVYHATWNNVGGGTNYTVFAHDGGKEDSAPVPFSTE